MIRCIIIDDEPLAQEILEHFISRFPTLALAAKCSNAVSAYEALHTQQVDLMFLDIKMPGINGLDFITSLKEPPAVIFTTAFAEYAIQGFDLEAIDYLLKPVTFERFEKSINKVLKLRQPEVEKEYTYFKISGRLIKIAHEELLYAQSMKDYVLLYTKSGKYVTYMTMKYLNGLLPSAYFVRVHRSYFVNLGSIRLIERNRLHIGTEIVPVGDNYRLDLEKAISGY